MLDRARRIATATLGDALDAHGIAGVLSGLPRRSGQGRVAGFAVTMLEQVAPLGSFAFGDFAVGQGFDAAEKDSVLLIDMGGADVSSFGGLAALTLHMREAAAAVIDGGCRDVEEIIATGLTVASRHVTPRTGKGRVRVLSVGQPVCCGGVIIRQGDLIVIDDTGIVAIPRGEAEAVLETAEVLAARDEEFAARLRQGEGFSPSSSLLRHA